jgi:predicted phosphoribosyltransferase
VVVLGITPSGVEIAASASKAMDTAFDVVVATHVRLDGLGIVGAIAEDGRAALDPAFEPRFGIMESLNAAIDRARRAVKRERLLFRGQRSLRSVTGMDVVVVDGHLTSPWKALAVVNAVSEGEPAHILIAAPVGTQSVQEHLSARKVEFVCPTIIVDPAGHPRPFGDPEDPSSERLRSIVVAREST